MGGSWGDHPELVRLRENYRKRKVLVEEVKAEMRAQKKVEPVVRVIEDKPFKPGMTIRIRREAVFRL